jgi:hypothetical protein
MATHTELANSTACPNKSFAGKCGRISEWQPLPDGMHYLVHINGGRGAFVHGKYLPTSAMKKSSTRLRLMF